MVPRLDEEHQADDEERGADHHQGDRDRVDPGSVTYSYGDLLRESAERTASYQSMSGASRSVPERYELEAIPVVHECRSARLERVHQRCAGPLTLVNEHETRVEPSSDLGSAV